MQTLLVYYSKTGNTKKVAEAVIKDLKCTVSELIFDEATKKIQGDHNPTGYDKVVIVSPVWGMSLAEPMKVYLNKYGKFIKSYNLIVTLGMFDLGGSARFCSGATGKPPAKMLKIKTSNVQSGSFDVKQAL